MRFVPLLLVIGCVAAKEKWSWGVLRDGKDAFSSSKIVFENNSAAEIPPFQARTHSASTPTFTSTSTSTTAQSNRQARKIEASVTKRDEEGNDKTEPRFFGLKKELCKHGIGLKCPSGYDLLEVQEPYSAYASYPVSQGYYGNVGHNVGHYGTGGISADQVLAVQPVALQPVGSPIQAVPLGPAGGAVGVGANFGGSYGTGIPHAGGVGIGSSVSGYGLPAAAPYPSYGAHHSVPVHGTAYQAPHQVYSPPSHDVHTSEVDFSGSFPTYDPEPDYEEIPQRDVSYSEPQVVKHYHTHTHIHKGGGYGGIGVGPFGKDTSFSESHLTQEVGTRPVRSHTLPVVEPHSTVLNSLRRGDCECVPNNFCSPSDIIGRSNDLPLLDARNNPSDILSTASNNEKHGAASEANEVVVNPPKTQKNKRDLKTTFKIFNNTEGRQVHGTYRIRHVRRSQACPRGEVCCRSPGFTARELAYKCGKKNAAGVLGRVRNAKYEVQAGDTQFGEYPWQAAILKRESQEVIYVCGGALVNDKHVLTAAHCVNGMTPGELKVRLGEWDVNRKTEFYNDIETGVERILVHPEFYSGTLSNDVAVITLEKPVDFSSNPHINPVCLPHSHSDFTNHHCYVTGWGKDAFGNDGNFQFILKEVEVPVWGYQGCQTALRKTRLGRSYKLDDGMVCAGGEEGKDACKGDGGGPLVCQTSDGSMELAGIVSWGIGCGERGIPGVYVNVPYYMEWITNTLKTF